MSPESGLSYHEVRMSACRALLRRFIRRWVIYLTVGMLLLGGAGGATLPALKGLAAGEIGRAHV